MGKITKSKSNSKKSTAAATRFGSPTKKIARASKTLNLKKVASKKQASPKKASKTLTKEVVVFKDQKDYFSKNEKYSKM